MVVVVHETPGWTGGDVAAAKHAIPPRISPTREKAIMIETV